MKHFRSSEAKASNLSSWALEARMGLPDVLRVMVAEDALHQSSAI